MSGELISTEMFSNLMVKLTPSHAIAARLYHEDLNVLEVTVTDKRYADSPKRTVRCPLQSLYGCPCYGDVIYAELELPLPCDGMRRNWTERVYEAFRIGGLNCVSATRFENMVYFTGLSAPHVNQLLFCGTFAGLPGPNGLPSILRKMIDHILKSARPDGKKYVSERVQQIVSHIYNQTTQLTSLPLEELGRRIRHRHFWRKDDEFIPITPLSPNGSLIEDTEFFERGKIEDVIFFLEASKIEGYSQTSLEKLNHYLANLIDHDKIEQGLTKQKDSANLKS